MGNLLKIKTLEKRLIEKGITDFKSKGSLMNFLKTHPCDFFATDTHVCSLEFKEFHELELRRAEEYGIRKIEVIGYRLIEFGIDVFKQDGILTNHLENRSDYFGTSVHLSSVETQQEP